MTNEIEDLCARLEGFAANALIDEAAAKLREMAENLKKPIPYTHAIGEAGQAYINRVSANGDAVLGGNFYYANLWDAMQRAAVADAGEG